MNRGYLKRGTRAGQVLRWKTLLCAFGLTLTIGSCKQPTGAVLKDGGEAQMPAAPVAGRRVDLMSGRMTIEVPVGSRVAPRGSNLMGAPPSSETETRVLVDRDVERIVILAKELDAIAGADIEKALSDLAKQQTSSRSGTLVIERFATPMLRTYRLKPERVPTDGEANFLAAYFVVLPDQLLVQLDFYLNVDASQRSGHYAGVVESMVRTLRAGNRNIDLSAGQRNLGNDLTVRVPAGYTMAAREGVDFRVYRLRKVRALGAPSAGISVYVGHHPSKHRESGGEGVKGKLFGVDVEWSVTDLPRTMDGRAARAMETIQPIPGVQSQAHVRLRAEGSALMNELRGIAESLAPHSGDTTGTRPELDREAEHTLASTPTPWIKLAGAKHNAAGIALDQTHVYFGDMGGTLYKVPKGGGQVVELGKAGGWPPSTIAVDDTHVYWGGSFGRALMRVAKVGGPATELAKASRLDGLVLHDKDVYWAQDGAVWRVSKTGGRPTKLAADQEGATNLTTDGKNLYWINAPDKLGVDAKWKLMKVALSGGEPIELASLHSNRCCNLAIAHGRAYWIGEASGGTGPLNAVRTSGGEIATIATVPAGWVMSIAVDDKFIYWSSQEPTAIYKISIKGGGVSSVALDQGGPLEISVDASGVYWTNQTGGDAVMKRPKE